jgi:DNA repair protein RecN (Recombination protein N)
VAAGASKYLVAAVADPNRLSAVEERLFRLEGILRQHGPTLADVIAAQDRLARELADITGAESRIADEERALDDRLPAAEERALALSTQRKKAAERLGAAISGELAELGMGGARVRVEVEPLPPRDAGSALAVGNARLGRDGIDRVEFLIAPNKGIDPRPLRKIASGGELSRALLALKRVLAESGPAGLYVFDEVDAGVGGAVAERIGAAIADVARHHQVLCITHLAPIAAFADAHFVISKSDVKDASGDRTTSRVKQLSGPALVHEVARMLAGAKVGQAAIAAAEELLSDSRKAKKAMGSAADRAATEKPAAKKKRA